MKYHYLALLAFLIAAGISYASHIEVPAGFASPDAISYPANVQVPASGSASLTINIDHDIVWGNVYYLDDGRWIPYQLSGTFIGSTDWIEGPATTTISIPSSALSDQNNLIIITYGCDGSFTAGWSCSSADGDPAWEVLIIPISTQPAVPPLPSGAICGDDVCELGEDENSCPADCASGSITEPIPEGWPTFLHDDQRTGVADGDGPQQGTVAWTKAGEVLARDSTGAPTKTKYFGDEGVLAADAGRVYVHTTVWQRGDHWDYITALNPATGAMKWEYRMPLCTDGFADRRSDKTTNVRDIILEGGTLYVPQDGAKCGFDYGTFTSDAMTGSGGGFIVLGAETGSLERTLHKTEYKFYDVPSSAENIIVSGNRIYYYSQKDYLVALDSFTGAIIFKTPIANLGEGGSISSLSLSPDGILYANGVKEEVVGEDEVRKSYIIGFDTTTGAKVFEKTFELTEAGRISAPLVIDGDYLYAKAGERSTFAAGSGPGSELVRINRKDGTSSIVYSDQKYTLFFVGPDGTSYGMGSNARIGPKKTAGNRAIYRYQSGDTDAYIGVGDAGKIVWVAGAPSGDEVGVVAAADAIFDTRDASGGTGIDKTEFYSYSPMDSTFGWKLMQDGEFDIAFASNGALYVTNNEEGEGRTLTAIK
ncbi:MAG: PQQ-binding-like beta-propeller repeat protein [Candidatus Aenigmarchaeota archaeon]|nr:PQQ-binding-like beta-propeller repeat protein [Candidatus Aenigmarchaeota archaeon]